MHRFLLRACGQVLLGLPYTASIDVWSLGCIAAELFLGIPVLPGANQFHQMARIVAMFGCALLVCVARLRCPFALLV